MKILYIFIGLLFYQVIRMLVGYYILLNSFWYCMSYNLFVHVSCKKKTLYVTYKDLPTSNQVCV